MALAEVCWTYTDEAPLLATYSLYPIVKEFCKTCDIDVSMKDISVAGRVLAQFPDKLSDAQRVPDELTNLGELAKTPGANIIKLPNISASIPQLKACIAELQAKGYPIPDFPEDPKTDEEKAAKAAYAKILGSAVNPVLREGNSDRRAAVPVKNYAKKFPHRMGPWNADSKTHVAHMTEGDFFGSEQSVTIDAEKNLRIEHVAADGTVTVLKQGLKMTAGEVCDSTRMSVKALQAYFEREMQECKEQDILFSLHLKATMMKVSDPIMFGHCVKVYFKDLFAKHGDTLASIGVNPNNGFGDVVGKLGQLPEEKRKEIEADIEACFASRPKLAMVNSNRGITNLHVPSDVIIDASMPAMIRGMDGLGGGMWCPDSAPGAKDSHLVDTKALIPDRCYAGVFKEAVAFCKENGAFDPATMGSVPNVGLMALKAEEYGSHDKTFEAPSDGKMRVVTEAGETLMEHDVETGDIWRACQTKDIAIRDWVKLAVTRGRACGWPVIFWLDENRAHDAQIIAKVNAYLPDHDTSGLEIKIMEPAAACRFSLERAKRGESTISVTGNVLRDYNTDLFPILELGTSAKMLSIVPLLAGGGMYETGAGGSAPKHVEQFQQEGHLRWDSLGEFLALAVSLEEIGVKKENDKVKALAAALNSANEQFLDANKNPSRKVKEIDNRGSHFYLALYWAQNLAGCGNEELQARFGPIAEKLTAAEGQIAQELIDCQGEPVDFGGYFKPVDELAFAAMRPSPTFNGIVDGMSA
jgi:isocitrate dehydrogenase